MDPLSPSATPAPLTRNTAAWRTDTEPQVPAGHTAWTGFRSSRIEDTDESKCLAGVGRGTLQLVLFRSLRLAGEILIALLDYLVLSVRQGGRLDMDMRARWLQRTCQRGLRALQVHISNSGPVPTRGLLVCNHLSYLDILALGALTPCVFVSKCEVKRWPVFGWCALLAGTLFVRRGRRSDVRRLTRAMSRVLEHGALVVLFPEGTTTNGRDVLPFKSSLLEPATLHQAVLTAGCIGYALEDGNVAEEICYWGDTILLPHLLHLMGKRRIEARLKFSRLEQPAAHRKVLARQLHAAVRQLKADLEQPDTL